MMLIGLSGKLGSGKDTAFQEIESLVAGHYGCRAIRDAFVDRLKISAMRALQGDIPDPQEAVSFANEIKEHGVIGITVGDKYREISGREYLQFYGTEAHRDIFGKDFWTSVVIPDSEAPDYGRSDIRDLQQGGVFPVLVITDCRFPDEAEVIRKARGEIWEIVRSSAMITSTHISETPLPRNLVDHVITNNGTVQNLRDKLQSHVRRILA